MNWRGEATGSKFSSLLIRRAIVPSCRWRMEQSRKDYCTWLTSHAYHFFVHRSAVNDQTRKAPRTGEGSDFVRLL